VRIEHKNSEILRHRKQNEIMHEMSEIQTFNICMQEEETLRSLCTRSSLRELFALEELSEVKMQSVQENT